jgi:hypothetical protein
MADKQKGAGKAYATIVKFQGGRVDTITDDLNLEKVPVMTLAHYDARPGGGTNLYDGVADTIAAVDKAMVARPGGVHFGIVLDESGSMGGNTQSVIDGINEFVGTLRGQPVEGEGRAMIVIFTDGMENQSERHTRESISALIKERENQGWAFSYMGANHDAWAGAGAMGIDTSKAGSVTAFAATKKGTTSGMKRNSYYSVNYLAGGESGLRAAASAMPTTVGEDEDALAGVVPGSAQPGSVPADKLWTPQDAANQAVPPAAFQSPYASNISDAIAKATGKTEEGEE